MNVFISQPTNGLIKKRRLEILDTIKTRYPTKKIYILDPIFTNDPIDIPYDSVWYLGKTLEILTQADLVFFSKDWETDYICSLEHAICRYYNIPIICEDEYYFTHESVYANNSPLSPLGLSPLVRR